MVRLLLSPFLEKLFILLFLLIPLLVFSSLWFITLPVFGVNVFFGMSLLKSPPYVSLGSSCVISIRFFTGMSIRGGSFAYYDRKSRFFLDFIENNSFTNLNFFGSPHT